jgi:hypothetical protein
MLTWKLPIIMLLGIFLFIGFEIKASGASACDDTAARLVARAYVLSIPMFFKQNDLIPLLNDNKAYFVEGGKAIRCMEALGTALVQGGMAAADRFKGYPATERFGGSMPPGLEHLPGQVDSSLRSYGNDMFAMGQELLWLSQVLPPAAKGDYAPYNTTATPNRQRVVQVLPIYQALCQMDAGMCQMMQNMMIQMEPSVEQQIYTLSRQLGN